MKIAPVIRLINVTKQYDNSVLAVDSVSFEVQAGTLLALLGASGCGKTSTLRLIAGLERPSSGEIWLNDRLVAGNGVWVEPEKRRVGMVFQDYALFPHMTVTDNILFALKDFPRRERKARVQEMLELVGLPDMGRRYPHQLSGGQQQRVALARALAPSPDIVLLDEPFSNLDAALRRSTREEVRQILKSANTTTVFVTHDQEEALAIADQVAVLREGCLLQIGTPRELYNQPNQKAVAAFIGEANFVEGKALGQYVQTALGNLPLHHHQHGRVEVLIRPESLMLHPKADGAFRIKHVQFLGFDQFVTIPLPDKTEIYARVRSHIELIPDMPVDIQVQGNVCAYPLK
ncbi:MAG: ABC transporter ATP-binding protein [Phototrophicales bacterium]|nr:MAG: ABC transporter ATP-binding protein [Phototrophicales bacterium]